jgi:hypothetical protein
MKRTEFLKSALLTSGGLMTGLINPIKAFSNLNRVKPAYIHLPTMVNYYFPIIANLTNQPASSCYCNGNSCSKNTAPTDNYYSPSNLWNVLYDSRLLFSQYLSDPNYSADYLVNASVPFFTSAYEPIMRIEGPSLLGLCRALGDYKKYASSNVQPKDIFTPLWAHSNAGYRFDTEPCHETVYETNKGTTTITYNKAESKVKVVAENKPKGILYHSNDYTI